MEPRPEMDAINFSLNYFEGRSPPSGIYLNNMDLYLQYGPV